MKYLPLQITEHESKRTWLPLGNAGPSYGARQQRAAKERASYSKMNFIFLYLTQKKSYVVH